MTADILLEKGESPQKLAGIEKKRYLLKKKIIRHLYLSGPKSNPEICKSTNMSSPTITGLLNELIEQGIVNEVGAGTSSGGRRPNMYGLRSDSRYVIGIDIARYSSTIAIFDINNQLVGNIAEFNAKIEDGDLLFDKLYNAVLKVTEEADIPYEKIIALGLDMPGLVDSKRGINYTYLFDNERTLQERFEQKFQKPVYIENDARVMALGEYRFGLAQGRKNVMCLKVSWGVGLGMILNGAVYHGFTGFAGEFGHIQMVQDGELCTCGKRGCLETVSSAKALVKFAKEGLREGRVSILVDQTGNDPEQLTAKMIINAAKSGDEFSINILSKIGRELGRGLTSLIHLMNPEAIIIGGLMAEADQYITAPIQQSINKYSIPNISKETEILVSELKDQSGVLGTAALVWEQVLSE